MLQPFHNARYMSLSLDAVEVLAGSPDFVARELSPYGNLKSFKLKTPKTYHNTVIPVHMMTYLFNTSPCVEFSVEWRRCERYLKHKRFRCKHCSSLRKQAASEDFC